MEIFFIVLIFAYVIYVIGANVTEYRQTDEELRSKYKYPYCDTCGCKIRRNDFNKCADCHKW